MPLPSKRNVPRIDAETYEECKKIRAAGGEPCFHTNVDFGYGLAGGGCGIYSYCTDCGQILAKSQDECE